MTLRKPKEAVAPQTELPASREEDVFNETPAPEGQESEERGWPILRVGQSYNGKSTDHCPIRKRRIVAVKDRWVEWAPADDYRPVSRYRVMKASSFRSWIRRASLSPDMNRPSVSGVESKESDL